MLPIKDLEEIKYYITICKEQHIGRDKLREKIKNKEYNRLPFDTRKKLMLKEFIKINDLVPDPILIKK